MTETDPKIIELVHEGPAVLSGWPKAKPCLGCGKSCKATGPGDRYCKTCRGRAAAIDTGPAASFAFER